jgi:hypothetical protein
MMIGMGFMMILVAAFIVIGLSVITARNAPAKRKRGYESYDGDLDPSIYIDEKPKRDSEYFLAADGELLEVVDGEDD